MFRLVRVSKIEDGAFGVFMDEEKKPVCLTLERTFENLETVIPIGIWECRRRMYFKGGYETFEIIVPGHTAVLFHKGNKETDSLGCILTGEGIGTFGANVGVVNSGVAFEKRFWPAVNKLQVFTLEVIEA